MSREIDRRNFSVNRVTSTREAEFESFASEIRLPGDHRLKVTKFDAVTGNPAVVVSESAPKEKGNYIQRALNHVQNIGRVLGMTATQSSEFVADPNIQKTSSGAVAVHLQQQYKSIPIFQATKTVRFAPDGTLRETVGSSISITKDNSSDLSPEMDAVSPKLSVENAVEEAAKHIAVPQQDEQGKTDQFGQPLKRASMDITGFKPKVMATFTNKPERPTVLETGPFGDKITANLIWFPLDDLRLCWEVIITMPNYQGQYRTIIDTENNEILYCHQLMKYVVARGNVYRIDGGSIRQMTDFPRPLIDYSLYSPHGDLPVDFPDTWVETDNTIGNAVNAHLDDNGPTIQGMIHNGILTFNPDNPLGDEQKVLNIFYYNCYMHDFFYLLGFREMDGNFQHNNLNRGGIATDRVDACAHSGAVEGTANIGPLPFPVDGKSPIMNMGLVTITNRHTAFDSSVVFHEFMHGVTNRLVGGPMDGSALEALQSAGMGEGWSDYIACTINNSSVVGSWVINDPKGIREYPYDSNFPDHFGMLGRGRYYGEEHNIGEIWCATLMEMNRKIGIELENRDDGIRLGLQLVIDALKLSPANPSFLDERDSILRALDDKLSAGQLSSEEYSKTRKAIWATFAKFGMGPRAQSNGASLSGIRQDFSMPDEGGPNVQIDATPNLPIPDKQPAGVMSELNIQQTGKVRRLTIDIDIEHTYIGDLRISLTAPENMTVELPKPIGRGANLIRSYTTDDTPALAKFRGQEINGNWKLKVADVAKRDIGTLRRWRLNIELDL